MATKPRDLDLPVAYSRDGSKQGYPTGSPRGKEAVSQYALYVRSLWDEQDEYMAALQQVWTRNMLFLSSRHWWERGRDGVYRPIKKPTWKEEPVTNLVLAFWRTYVAKLLKNRPAWTVMPSSTEPDDVHAAELADQVLEAKWQELRLARTLKLAVGWATSCGSGFLYPYWNEKSGQMVPAEVIMEVPVYDEDGEQVGTEEATVLLNKAGDPQLLPDGRPDPAAEPVMVDQGDIGVRAYSGFQVRVNPEAETDEDLRWVIIAQVRTIREAALLYGKKAADIVPEEVDDRDLDRALTAMGRMGSQEPQSPAQDHRAEHLDKYLELHYHEAPSEEYPNGRYWVCSRDVMLVEPDDEQGLPEGIWPPVAHIRDIQVPGRFYGSANVEHIVPINKQYNEINASIREHHNLMAKGKWLVPRGSGLGPGDITNAPGEVVQFNPGFAPTQAQISPLPQTIVEERNRVLSDFETVSGLHRVSMGKAPPGVSAGIAFLQLQEADDSDLGPVLDDIERAVAQLAGNVIQIIRARYTTERLIHVVGKDRRYQVRSFRGADLRGAGDVVAQSGSSFPWGKMAQQSLLLSLAQQMPQLFTNPETGQFDTAKFARLLPVGGMGNIGNESDLDVQEAMREEEQFQDWDGQSQLPVQPGFWQNHDVHYLQHVRVLKSAAFQDWPPMAQQAFIQHVEMTQQARDQKAMQSAQMQAMAQGNAPKEMYQQQGAQAPPNLTEEDLAGMSPDEIDALAMEDVPDWLAEEVNGPRPPAAPADYPLF
jgi:hypothetical protein